MKFHINPTTGDAGKCSATKGQCPFGGESEHYTSADAARSAYENKQGEQAELEAAQKDLNTYGANSNVFRTWGKIHSDFKTTTDGKRRVLANGGAQGTVLTPWRGPKVLERLAEKSSEALPSLEPTPPMNGWSMTINKLELSKVAVNERYYDKFGSVYEVAKVETDATGATTAAKMRVVGDDGVPIGDVKAAGVTVSDRRNHPSKFFKLVNLQKTSGYIDSTPGQSESKAVSDFPEGKGRYDYAALASLTYSNEDGNPEQIELLAPIGRLTDGRRIELGRQLWAFTGKDPKRYEDVSDKDKLQWANQRIMRRNNFEWANDGDTISYSHENGTGSKNATRMKLVNLGD